MAISIGQNITLSSGIRTGVAPGQTQFGVGSGSNIKVIGKRTIGTTVFFNIKHLTQGGGTGWVRGSSLRSSSGSAKPTTKSQVQPFLTQTQISTVRDTSLPTVRSDEEIRKGLGEEGLETVDLGDRPEVPSLRGQFEELREEQGVEKLELSLTELKAAEDEAFATMRQRKAAAREPGVLQGVIEGRIGEVERQERENIDFIQRQKSRVVEELEMRYSTISMMMDLTQQDYQNSLADYNSKFKQNIDMINLIRDIKQDEKDELQQAKDNAIANLEIYINLALEGKLNISKLSSAQKMNIAKLEVASGFDIGFVAAIRQPPTQEIIATNSLSNGQTQLVFRDRNTGRVTTQRFGRAIPKAAPKGPAPGSSASTRASAVKFADTIRAGNVNGEWVGRFPKMVIEFASSMTLQDIYRAYADSNAGKKWGKPNEDSQLIEVLYKQYK